MSETKEISTEERSIGEIAPRARAQYVEKLVLKRKSIIRYVEQIHCMDPSTFCVEIHFAITIP